MKKHQEIGDRLKQFAQEKFGSVAELERKMKVPKNSLSQYIGGRHTPGTTLQDKLRDVGCDIEWLMTGHSRTGGGSHVIQFPINSIAPYMGRIYAEPDGKEYFEEHHNGEVGIPMSPGNFFCLLVDNDSLINADPIPIYPGDICIFEYNRQPKNDDIVAVELTNGKRTVKILKHKNRDFVTLHSANKFRNYPSFDVKKTDIKTFGIFVEKRQMTDQQKKRYGIK